MASNIRVRAKTPRSKSIKYAMEYNAGIRSDGTRLSERDKGYRLGYVSAVKAMKKSGRRKSKR